MFSVSHRHFFMIPLEFRRAHMYIERMSMGCIHRGATQIRRTKSLHSIRSIWPCFNRQILLLFKEPHALTSERIDLTRHGKL